MIVSDKEYMNEEYEHWNLITHIFNVKKWKKFSFSKSLKVFHKDFNMKQTKPMIAYHLYNYREKTNYLKLFGKSTKNQAQILL